MQCNSGKSAIDFDDRRRELLELSSYIQTIDNDVTMILQSLQWDRKHLTEASPMVTCRYDNNHRIPPDKLQGHEKECSLRSLGYAKGDLLLPEPFDANASTLITLNKNDIQNIIDYAAKVDPVFKKGRGTMDPREPLSLELLQHTYSADERRAFHDAVVSAAPSCHDLSELALLGGDDKTQNIKPKSRAEIIAELRDMKRRRAKYRGAAKTKNYSDELRSVIATQMEHYSEAFGATVKNDSDNNKSNIEKSKDFRPIQVKKEPIESDNVYGIEKEKRRAASREYDRHKETRQRDKSKHDNRQHKNKDEFRHKENYRNETRHSDKRDKYTGREKADDDYKRDRNDRRHKGDRDRYSSSSKERSRDRNDYRNNDKYRDGYYKDHKSSSNSEVRYKEKQDSREKYKEEKHKRYYDYKQEYEVAKKRIKTEKD